MHHQILLSALLVLPLAATGASQETCTLTVELVDDATGASLPGLLRMTDAEGNRVDLNESLLNRGLGMGGTMPISGWSVLLGRGSMAVPCERLVIEAFSGLETERARVPIDLRGKPRETIRVPLRRFYDAAANGYRSGNTHLHLRRFRRGLADRYLLEIPKADGLDVVYVSYLERAGDDRDYISNRYTKADLDRLSASGVLFGHGQEHRHNLADYGEGYGHVMFLEQGALIQPVSIGPGIMKTGTDGIPIQRGIDTARRRGATIVWCHNNWGMEAIPNWLTGRVHAQNIFDGGTHGSYKDSFYRYLNAGLRVPFSTGTDWFIYDFSRVYVPIAEPLTTRRWREVLATGRSYITNGPFLEFTVDRVGPGQVVALDNPGPVRIVARVVGRVNFERIELVQNGRVVKQATSRAVGGHFLAQLNTSLDVTGPCWLALRTPPPPVPDDATLQTPVPLNELGGPLFGHTSPVYVEVAGKAFFDPTTARALLADMQRSLRTIDTDAVLFANDRERQRVRKVYEEAIATLGKRLMQ